MAKKSSMHRNRVVGKVLIYALLILITAVMVVPFLWMLSASIKTNTEVFDITPFQFIPDEPQWSNYQEIWTEDTAGEIYREHGVPDDRCHDPSDADQQFCGVRVCKAPV